MRQLWHTNEGEGMHSEMMALLNQFSVQLCLPFKS